MSSDFFGIIVLVKSYKVESIKLTFLLYTFYFQLSIMCLSIPYKIKELDGVKAVVRTHDNKDRQIDVKLLKNLKVGDWVLSLNNFAIEKISAQEADEIIKLYNYE